MLFIFYFLLVTFCSLFVTFSSLRVTFCSLHNLILISILLEILVRALGPLRVLLIHRVYDHAVYYDLLHAYFIGDTCFGAGKCMLNTSNKL